MKIRHVAKVIYSLALLCLAAATVYLHVYINESYPLISAQKGLVEINAPITQTAAIGGEWEIAESMGGDIIGYTNNILIISERTKSSYYSCTIKSSEILYFYIIEPLYAKIWINGILVDTLEESRYPEGVYLLNSLNNDADEYRITIQLTGISAHGASFGILLGSRSSLRYFSQMRLQTEFFCLGLCIMSIIYVVSLFLSKKSEKYLLTFALVYGSCLLNMLTNCHDLYITRIFWMSSAGNYMSQIRTMQLIVSLLLRLRLFQQFIGEPLHQRTIWKCCALLFATYSLCLFGIIPSSMLRGYVTAAFYLIELGVLYYHYLHGRKEAACVLPCCVMNAMICLWPQLMTWLQIEVSNDILIMPVKYILILYNTMILFFINRKFGGKFTQADLLTEQLKDLNQNLEQKVQKKAEALEDSYQALIDAHKDHQSFINGLIHNLRSPLFAISGYLELAENSQDEQERRRYFTDIALSTQFIHEMTDKLFLFTKLQDTVVTFEHNVFSMADLLKQLLDDHQSEFAKNKLKVIMDLGSTDCDVDSDSFYLAQVINNLLENAIKYNRENGTIFVTSKEELHAILVQIADTGIGISEEELPSIFEAYYKGSNICRRESTGLGLAIAYRIVVALGGTLEVESTLGKGSTFAITLPRQ